MSNFVSAKWLYEHLKDEGLVIVDCRADLYDKEFGIRQYRAAHIPKAQFLDVKSDMAGEVKEHGGRSPLPNLEAFSRKLENIGVSGDSTVVAYDEAELAGAERLWWMLKHIGHERVFVLNGGIKAWEREGYSLTSEINKAFTGRLNVKLNNSIITDISEIKANMGKESFVIVDSRTPERYRGEVEPIDRKAGHIPGAVNYHWKDALKENGEFKSEKELKVHYKNLDDYETITVQCGSGIDACGNFIAMSEIGLRPRLYVGSWSDWVSYEDNPVAVTKKL